MRAQQLLDQVQSPQRIAALEEDPRAYAVQLGEELAAGESSEAIAARDEQLREALARIDAMTERATRIRIDHALADDAAIGVPTRKVFASTVLRYAGALDVLHARAHDVASRGGSADPAHAAEVVVDAARSALALRAAVREGVLALVSDGAAAGARAADALARDRRLEEAPRRAWSALRRELEAVAAQPARITVAALATRVAEWPEQLDEPDPASEPTFADMIELD
jgi:hypothetical protein